MFGNLSASVCTKPWAEPLAGPVLVSGAVLHRGIEQLQADWEKVPTPEVIFYFILYPLWPAFANYPVLCYRCVQLILAFVFCPAWAAPGNFLGQSLGTQLKHSKLPHLRGCLVLLLTDLGNCTWEKWPGAGEAVWGSELFTKAIVIVPSQHNSVNLPLHYCK